MFVSPLAPNCTQQQCHTKPEIEIRCENSRQCVEPKHTTQGSFLIYPASYSKANKREQMPDSSRHRRRRRIVCFAQSVHHSSTVAMAIQQLQDRDPISASKIHEIGSFLIRVTYPDTFGILTPGVRLVVGFTQRGRKDDTRKKNKTKKNPPGASE